MEKTTTGFGNLMVATLIGAASTILLLSYSIDLRMSSLLRLWIASQLIVLVIWKFSDTETSTTMCGERLAVHHHQCAPENWYSDPSFICYTDASVPEPEPTLATPLQAGKGGLTTAVAQDHPDSMDDTWKAIVESSGEGRRAVLTKSDTWQGRGSPEAAVRTLRRSDTAVGIKMDESAPAAVTPRGEKKKEKKAAEGGWRGRERLLEGPDELFQRVETFIKKHHDHLRLQRQESAQQRFTERLP